MSLPNFDKRFLTKKEIRNKIVKHFLFKINTIIGKREVDKLSEKFQVGDHFYYHSKYGGKLKLKLAGFAYDAEKDGDSFLICEENIYRYESKYCHTIQKIREQKLNKINDD